VSRRIAAILLHPSSLPGNGGLGREAFGFVDFLANAGCSAWQMLPLGPVGPGNSPYASRSAFACEPLLISLEELAAQGLLDPRCDFTPDGDPHHWDFERLREHREPLLRAACAEFLGGGGGHLLAEFAAARPWLMPYARFAAVRELSDQPWWLWPERYHDPGGYPESDRTALGDEVRYQCFLQWAVAGQWRALSEYAHLKGIALYGDVPIFVDLDSADAWANQHLFKLDPGGKPRVVAGVPPDAFAATGQRWGNPHYDWRAMREDGYDWWCARMRRTFELFDAVRIDHFRGFESAWEIPAEEPTAVNGHWQPGPGRELFDVLAAKLGPLPIIVEDLGLITPAVRALRDELGYPGMAVLQFAFGDDDKNPYLPHNHVANQVVFTGTHDNDTTLGWYRNAPEHDRHHVRTYLGIDGEDIVNDLVSSAYRSVAETAIIPMQDVLQLGSEARMNVPGLGVGNWTWRFTWDQLEPGRTEWLRALAVETDRLPAATGAK